jgi:hypothetical protein
VYVLSVDLFTERAEDILRNEMAHGLPRVRPPDDGH